MNGTGRLAMLVVPLSMTWVIEASRVWRKLPTSLTRVSAGGVTLPNQREFGAVIAFDSTGPVPLLTQIACRRFQNESGRICTRLLAMVTFLDSKFLIAAEQLLWACQTVLLYICAPSEFSTSMETSAKPPEFLESWKTMLFRMTPPMWPEMLRPRPMPRSQLMMRLFSTSVPRDHDQK